MNTAEAMSLWAFGMALVALFSWIAGHRSVLGKELSLRQGAPWVAFRWFGLGLWIATRLASDHDDFGLQLGGLAGAALLLFGTARKIGTARTPFQIGRQPCKAANDHSMQ